MVMPRIMVMVRMTSFEIQTPRRGWYLGGVGTSILSCQQLDIARQRGWADVTNERVPMSQLSKGGIDEEVGHLKMGS